MPDNFYERIKPTPVTAPELILFNQALAKDLDIKESTDREIAEAFAGNKILPGSDPLALAYAGHQYGHFVPQLGDGRAILLGEVIDIYGQRRDIQLKGSGQTRFSRQGDGRSPLGPVLREYVISEAMAVLSIPTTRSLAVVKTGEKVVREMMLPGGILTRVAASHLRVGTFEYFAARQDLKSLEILTKYAIARHYPKAKEAENPYEAFLKAVIDAQAFLVARWMQIGFIHGVMNTDNTSISGETIDYGPCAFIDAFDPAQVFSSIDRHGRYAYNQQSTIAHWNMESLAVCLLPLLHQDKEKAFVLAKDVLQSFIPLFEKYWLEGMKAKIGLKESYPEDLSLIEELLTLMKISQADFTLSFRSLGASLEEESDGSSLKTLFSYTPALEPWLMSWRKRLERENRPFQEIAQEMRSINPAYIPRNHRIEQAIKAAYDENDFTLAKRLMTILARPYEDQPENAEYQLPPRFEERVCKTFCGT